MTGRNSLQKQLQTIRQRIHFYSTHGDEEAIARLFLQAVQNHTIADSRDPLSWCFKTFGREDTEHVVKALAAWSCPVCKKGLEQCDLCDGSGWSGPDMLCETCIGLGVIPCQFCGGSGLSALDSLPSGLRLTVVGARAKLAAKRMKIVQSNLDGRGREPDRVNAKRKLGEALQIVNVLLSRLEGCLDEMKQMGQIHQRHRLLAARISSDCAKSGILGKRLITKVLREMVRAEESRMNDPQANEAMRTLCKMRTEIYRDLFESGPEWLGTSLQHPLLDRAIQRIKSPARWTTPGKCKGNSFRSGGKPRIAA